MTTYFITLRGPNGREEFRSCKRSTQAEAEQEATRLAETNHPPLTVVSVAPLRGVRKPKQNQ